MVDLPHIAGIILAGGQSRRMGRDKALLELKGKPLIRHMMDILLATGIEHIFISGEKGGYPSIPDTHPYAGPAQAIRGVLHNLPHYRGYLIVPVDMPFLNPDILHTLLRQEQGGYFIGNPLPAFLVPPFLTAEGTSVRAFLEAQGARPVDVLSAHDGAFLNINTPEIWAEVARSHEM